MILKTRYLHHVRDPRLVSRQADVIGVDRDLGKTLPSLTFADAIGNGCRSYERLLYQHLDFVPDQLLNGLHTMGQKFLVTLQSCKPQKDDVYSPEHVNPHGLTNATTDPESTNVRVAEPETSMQRLALRGRLSMRRCPTTSTRLRRRHICACRRTRCQCSVAQD